MYVFFTVKGMIKMYDDKRVDFAVVYHFLRFN